LSEGKVSITVSVAFEESAGVKESNSFKSTAVFENLEDLHEKTDIVSQKLLANLKKKLPAKFAQTKLGEGEATA
jgi:hypothetical protein